MTTRELNQLKNKLLQKNINSLDSITAMAEEMLADAIIAEALNLEVDKTNNLVDSKGNVVTMSQAIQNAFKKFRNGPQIKIIKNIIASFEGIGSLNESYFKAVAESKKKYEQIIDQVEREMRQRVGVTSAGDLVRGGFLFNLVNDTSMIAALQSTAQKGIMAKLKFDDYVKMVKVNVVGTPNLSGPLVQHYRTFVHDAFMAYDSIYGNQVATELGLDHFVYQGGLIETSREFCRLKNGRVFTRDEAERDWPNDPTLLTEKSERESGVKNYNPIQDRGRWRCRHHLNWIIDPKEKARTVK